VHEKERPTVSYVRGSNNFNEISEGTKYSLIPGERKSNYVTEILSVPYQDVYANNEPWKSYAPIETRNTMKTEPLTTQISDAPVTKNPSYNNIETLSVPCYKSDLNVDAKDRVTYTRGSTRNTQTPDDQEGAIKQYYFKEGYNSNTSSQPLKSAPFSGKISNNFSMYIFKNEGLGGTEFESLDFGRKNLIKSINTSLTKSFVNII